MKDVMRGSFISLIRLGIGQKEECISYNIKDWEAIGILAEQQGLLAVMVDGIDKLPLGQRPPKVLLLQWIGVVMREESRYEMQQKAAAGMALLFHENYIRTYVLKGDVVAECYPKPEHRVSSDIDCFLLPERGDFDAWSLGNDLMKSKGVEVEDGFYKNSSFYLSGLTVENHQFMTPFRGNKKLELLEIMLQSMMKEDLREDSGADKRKFEGVWLYRPPVMVSALFLIEHAYSHFLHEGLTWRHVLDWMMFSKKHQKDIDWYSLNAMIDEFGFRKFYNSYHRLGHFLLGEIEESELTKKDKLMLNDVWAELDLHETLHGVKGKLGLVGNTWRAGWKYHYFGDISMIHALWIQVKGFLFIKSPKLA